MILCQGCILYTGVTLNVGVIKVSIHYNKTVCKVIRICATPLRGLFLAARPSGSIRKYEKQSWCAIEIDVLCITDEIFGRIKLFCFYFTVKLKNMFN